MRTETAPHARTGVSTRSRLRHFDVGELVDWVGHSPERLEAMRAGLQRIGTGRIED